MCVCVCVCVCVCACVVGRSPWLRPTSAYALYQYLCACSIQCFVICTCLSRAVIYPAINRQKGGGILYMVGGDGGWGCICNYCHILGCAAK